MRVMVGGLPETCNDLKNSSELYIGAMIGCCR
jgi:hypothetical protein